MAKICIISFIFLIDFIQKAEMLFTGLKVVTNNNI